MSFDEFMALSEAGKAAYLRGSAAAPRSDPLIAARQWLGAWLSAEPYRYWEHGNWRPDGSDWVHLCEYQAGDPRDIVILGSGEGPDLAAAIMAALEKISG
jgi:hypothetical protein